MTPAAMRNRIARLLHRHVIYDRRASVEDLADATGKAGPTIYKYLEAECPIVLDILPALYEGAGRPVDLLRAIVAACDPSYDVVRVDTDAQPNGRFDDEKDDMAISVGRLTEDLREALKDGMIDDDEKEQLRARLRIIDEVVRRFHREIEAYGARSPRKEGV